VLLHGLQDDTRERIVIQTPQSFQHPTFYSGPVLWQTGESEEWMMVRKIFLSVLALAAAVQITACGGNSTDMNCSVVGLQVGPTTSTVNHTATPPGNSQMFSATFRFTGSRCTAATAALINSNWSASDPSVQLSASQATQVTATCTTAVANPVTITAQQVGGQQFTATATLTCQ